VPATSAPSGTEQPVDGAPAEDEQATPAAAAAAGVPAEQPDHGARCAWGEAACGPDEAEAGVVCRQRRIPLPNGYFFPLSSATTGYALVDEPGGPPFWTSYQLLGGFDVLGSPISRPFVLPNAHVYQVTERAMLVWRPGLSRAELADLLDLMSAAGLDDWLLARGIPPAVREPASPGADPAAAALARLAWLAEPAIRETYFGPSPDPSAALAGALDRFGLPTSWPERFETHVTQRFQRGVLRVAIEPAPDGTQPRAVPLPVGTLLRESGLLTPAALVEDSLVGGRLVARAPRPQLAWRSDAGWGIPAAPTIQPPSPAPSPSPPAAAATPAPAPATPSPQPSGPGAATPALVIRAVVNQGRSEHVTIANQGAAPQDLSGWTLRSATGGQTYVFPPGFTIAPGATVNVHSGAGDPATLNRPPGDLFATRTNIWRNTGDVAQLIDPTGRLVSEYRYGTP
jgi:hypothetical protein